MCVLVVEDEPIVRAVAVEALEAEGLEVIEAPSADYAMTLLQSRDDIDVVFTDVTMPGTLNGFDLARLVRKTYPHINVLVCSGALPPGFSGETPEARFVRKRYRVAEMTWPVRNYGLSFDAPVLASVDPWALLLSAAAVIAMFRFKVGMIPTLAACSVAGIVLYLLGVIA